MIALDDNFDEHPKFIELSNDATALWIRCLGYCRRNLTDGFVPETVAISSSRAAKKAKQRSIIDELCAPPKAAPHLAPLWQRVPGGYKYHDYLKGGWNPSKAEVEAKREQRRDVARKAGRASAASRAPNDSTDVEHACSTSDSASVEHACQPHADPIRSDPIQAADAERDGGALRGVLVGALVGHWLTSPLANNRKALDVLEGATVGLPTTMILDGVQWALAQLETAESTIGRPDQASVLKKLISGLNGEKTKLKRLAKEPSDQHAATRPDADHLAELRKRDDEDTARRLRNEPTSSGSMW